MASDQTFFDAVLADPEMTRVQKIRWLHQSATDYWERLMIVVPVLEEVAAHLDPTGTPHDDSGLHELHERVMFALETAKGAA